MQRSFRKLNRSDFQARCRGINRRAFGWFAPRGRTEVEGRSYSGARLTGFAIALVAGVLNTNPWLISSAAAYVQLDAHLFAIRAGLALTIGVILAHTFVHLLRLVILRQHSGPSAALMAGLVMGLVASNVPSDYVATAGSFAMDGVSRFAGTDLTVVTPDEIVRRFSDVVQR